MMESLRNFLTGPRLFIVIAACALPFVFLGTSSLSTPFQGDFGSINGENITEADMQTASTVAMQKFKNIYGDDFNFYELDESTQLETIKQELILQKVLLSEARSLGFVNSDTEIQAKKAIIRNPAFQIDGAFDEGVYEAQVNSAGFTKDSYVDSMTAVIAADLYRFSLSSSYFVTENEVKELAKILEQSVDIDFVKLDSDSLKKQIVNSEEEIKDFYDNNQILFYSEEKRSFRYILLEPQDYESLVSIPEGYIESAYEDYLSKAEQRDQIRFSHIMVDKLNYDNADEAFEIITEVSTKLKNGESFNNLASTYSEDVVSKDNGGDLEYFDADIFPEQFAEALEGLDVNQVSEIVELEDTFHILKITEVNESEIVSLDEMSKTIIDDLIKSESLALMNDDYDAIDEMIFSNATIESIGESISREILDESDKQLSDFDFVVSNTTIQDFIFSPDTEIGKPTILNLDDSIIVLSIKEIKEPKLQNFDDVYADASDYLSDNKTIEKRNLLTLELEAAKKENTLESFFNAYDFITKDSYVELKRNSSLLPPEVVAEVFKLSPGNSITLNARDGDVYMIDLIKINSPSSEFIDSVYDQYSSFSEQRISSNIAQIINEDIFESAKVNLNNLVF